jgi:hypothetical protein
MDFNFDFCLLLIDKTRAKDKTYIWVSVWWKTKTYFRFRQSNRTEKGFGFGLVQPKFFFLKRVKMRSSCRSFYWDLELQTIMREQLRKVSLPWYQSTLDTVFHRNGIWGWVIVRTGNCMGTVCSFRIWQNRTSTIDACSYNLPGYWTGPWRLLQRIGWCVSFHGQGTCSHTSRAEQGLFSLTVRGSFGLRRHNHPHCKTRVAREFPKSSWLFVT